MTDRTSEVFRHEESADVAEQASDAFRSEAYDYALAQPVAGGKGTRGALDRSADNQHQIKDKSEPAPLKPAEINRDSSGRPVDVTTPHGDRYEFVYDNSGKLSKLTVTHPSGKPEILERTEKGWWKVNGWVDHDLKSLEVFSDGTIKRTHDRDGVLVSYPNGAAEGRDVYDKVVLKVDEKGTRTVYRYEDRITSFGTKVVHKPGSPFAEIFSTFGDKFNEGYQFTHQNGHTETLERRDLAWQFTRGMRRETLPRDTKVEIEPDGHRKFTRPDGSSFEGKPDGTTIDRNSRGKVTEVTSPEGITTTFRRGDQDQVTDIEVRDSSGKLIESNKLTAEGWQTNLTDAAGKPLNVKKIDVDDKAGSCTFRFDNGQLVRSADGTEDQKNVAGMPIDAYDDKVVSWMKRADLDLSQAEEKTLRADLAVINKLPPEKKAWILISLDRIINGNSDAKTELSKTQRAELARSLAHQIAHPESISQGGKRAAVMASAERQMAGTRPDEYARMVADLAVDGKYTTRDRSAVRVQRTRDGFLEGKTDSYNQRTLTSELFQSAAANIVLEREGKTYKSYAAGEWAQHGGAPTPVPAGVDPSLDLGERVTDREGRVSGFDGLNKDQRKVLLGKLGLEGNDAGTISSERELVEAWNSRADKNAPLTIAITVPKERYHFWQEWHKSPEVDPSHHILTITHIDTTRNPAVIYFDNTAGGENHTYPGGQGVLSWDITNAHTGAYK